MSSKERIRIFDTTLRDGEQSPGASLNAEKKARIAEQLERLGVDVIEAGFPASSIGDFESVQAVCESARHTEIAALARCLPKDIQAAAKALEKVGKPAVEPLIAALNDQDRVVRWLAVKTLKSIGDAMAVEPLIAALKDEDDGVRVWVAGALGKLRDSRAVEPLIMALKDRYEDVRQQAAWALAEIGDTKAVEPLIASLKDINADVRFRVVLALGEFGVKLLPAKAGRFDVGWKPTKDHPRF